MTAPPDANAFESWARDSTLAMTRLARRLAPDADAEDIVQESLARAWLKRALFDPARGTPTTWLLAIVADQCRNARRSRVRALRVVDDAAELPDVPQRRTEPDADLDLDLERSISGLSQRQQLAIHLHYYLGLTVDETAQVMSCAPGTVKSTLFDARAGLRVLLGDIDD